MEKRQWKEIRKFEEIRFEEYNGIAKITINRPHYRNAFTPRTTLELSQAFAECRELARIRVVLLTGAMSEVPEGKRLDKPCSANHQYPTRRGNRVQSKPYRLLRKNCLRLYCDCSKRLSDTILFAK